MAKDENVRSDDETLEEMSLDGDIGSREGVSLDYMARVRIAFLLGQNQSMIAQTQFADAKAGALLAFVGLVATRGPGAVVGVGDVTPAIMLQVALHGLALIAGIVVLYPRYAGLNMRREMAKRERFSWPALASGGLMADDFGAFMRGSQLSQLVESIARSNHALSAILLQKFMWLRIAFVIAVLDVAVMAIRVALAGTLNA